MPTRPGNLVQLVLSLRSVLRMLYHWTLGISPWDCFCHKDGGLDKGFLLCLLHHQHSQGWKPSHSWLGVQAGGDTGRLNSETVLTLSSGERAESGAAGLKSREEEPARSPQLGCVI